MSLTQEQVRNLVNGMLQEHPIVVSGNAPESLREALQDKDIETLTGEYRYQFGALTKDGTILDGRAGRDNIIYISRQFDEIAKELTKDFPGNRQVPFYIDTGIDNIADELRDFLRTRSGLSPMLAILPLIDDPASIPEDKKYDPLRAVLKDIDTKFFQVHCPDNPELEHELNERLEPHRQRSLALSLYLSQYDNVPTWSEIVTGPAAGVMAGVGTAFAIDTIDHFVPNTTVAGAADALVYTAAEAGDSRATAISQANYAKERSGKDVADVNTQYGSNAISSAVAAYPLEALAAEVYTHHGTAGHLVGGILLALVNALGIAANAKDNQDDNMIAYTELLESNRIPPSDRITQFRHEVEQLSGEERTRKEKQLQRAVKRHATRLGRLETIASLPNRRANIALATAPISTFAPEHVREGLFGSAENFIVGLENLMGWGATRIRRSYEERRITGPLEKGRNPDPHRLARGTLRSASALQHMAYGLGYVGKAPEAVVRITKKTTHSVAAAGQHVAKLGKRNKQEKADSGQEEERER